MDQSDRHQRTSTQIDRGPLLMTASIATPSPPSTVRFLFGTGFVRGSRDGLAEGFYITDHRSMFGTLPPKEERGPLLEAIAALVKEHGAGPFLEHPLIEPNDACFPDPWSPDAIGAERMLRRLLGYAGLQRYDLHLQLYEGEVQRSLVAGVGGIAETTHKEGAAAWFAGIQGDVCHFGIDQSGLDDPERLAGVLSHEVAHAWRAHRRIPMGDELEEEQLTDITTLYLGFGILTCNAAYKYRTWGRLEGSKTYHSWSHQSAGYLSPESMSYLLAAQVVLRDASRTERRRVQRQLETNQASSFSSAVSSLSKNADDLRRMLGLPESPPGSTLFMHLKAEAEGRSRVAQPRPEAAMAGDDAPVETAEFAFRVNEPRQSAMWSAPVVGFLSGTALGVLTQSALVFGFALVGSIVVWRWLNRGFCSHCEASLARESSRCRSCGAAVVSEIRTSRDIHDARARYLGGLQRVDPSSNADERPDKSTG